MKFIHYFLACFSLLFIQTAFGDLICEQLPVGICSFSIASSGKRCVLETYASGDGTMKLQCKTSEAVVGTNMYMREHIETDECIAACGVDRKSLGISSDSLLDHRFTAKLCSPQCYQNCPNIVDLYYSLASEEGVLLPDLCKALRTISGRAMTSRFLSSGAAFGPAASAAAAPTASEAAFGPISSVDCAPPPM
nr:(+)-gamma-cadinene synthase [Ipomoea batatas]